MASKHVTVFCFFGDNSERPWLPCKKIYLKRSSGIAIKMGDNIGVLTTLHGVQYCHDCVIVESNTKHVLEKHIRIDAPELDLTFISVPDLTEYFVITDFAEIGIDQKKCIVHEEITESLKNNRQKKNLLKATIISHKLEKQMSLNYPMLQYFYIIFDDPDIYNDEQIKGLSGTCVLSNDKIIGILLNILNESNNVSIIPTSMILMFLTHISENNSREPNNYYLMGVPFLYTVGDTDLGDGKQSNILIVTKTYCSQIKNDDIISNINGLSFNKHGFINSVNLPIDTWISMNNLKKMSLTLFRDVKKNDDYQKMDVIISSHLINTKIKIPISSKIEYFIWSGLIFVELTENILKYYHDSGISLYTSLIEHHFNNPFDDINKKIIVMIDADKTYMSPKIQELFIKHKLPILHSNTDIYDVPIVTKCDGKNVKNLADLIDKLHIGNMHRILMTTRFNGRFKFDFDEAITNVVTTN
jgi:hypothetical protein